MLTAREHAHRRERHADRHLKPPQEMARRFAAFPDAIVATQDIAALCTFDLGELSYQYPYEEVVTGLSAQGALEQLTREAAARMFPMTCRLHTNSSSRTSCG